MREELTLRPLNAGDIFPMAEILGAIGAEQLRGCFQSDRVKAMLEAGVPEEQVGSVILCAIADLILGKMQTCRKPLMEFLASLAGTNPEKLEQESPAAAVRLLKGLFRQEDFGDFISAVSELLNGAA